MNDRPILYHDSFGNPFVVIDDEQIPIEPDGGYQNLLREQKKMCAENGHSPRIKGDLSYYCTRCNEQDVDPPEITIEQFKSALTKVQTLFPGIKWTDE